MFDQLYDFKMINSEIRAYETHLNLNLFLNDSIISSATESFSMNESFTKLKEMVSNFFKRLLAAIQRFFARIFGNGDRIMHKTAIDKIRDAIRWFEAGLRSDVSKINVSSITFMQDQQEYCDKCKEDIKKIINTQKDKSYYIPVKKNAFTELVNFSKNTEVLVDSILKGIEMRKIEMDIGQTFISKYLSIVSTIEQTILEMIQMSIWTQRLSNNETLLDKPIEIELDFD